jgi:hypothetical protein
MAAVHRLVLVGDAPDLARFYPSAAERLADGDPWPAFRATLAADAARIRELVDRPCQTNEVGRSGALVGGFLVVAAETGLPLRVLEIGSSGGLNLRWDQYRYEAEEWAWGDPASPVRFTGLFEGRSRPPPAPAEVVQRAGCDSDPVDIASEDGRLTLMASTWPDQAGRFPHLRGALEVAARVPATVEPADAASWLGVRLGERREGVATVVFHSIVMQYLGRDGRDRVAEVLAEAGRRATPQAPLARLQLEPTDADPSRGEFLVGLETWPAGEERLLARAHPHGPPVEWVA